MRHDCRELGARVNRTSTYIANCEGHTAPTVASFAPPSGPLTAEIPVELLKQFPVEEYDTRIKAGVFVEGENSELLEGLIIHKRPDSPGRWITVELLRAALQELNIAGYRVPCQNPVTTNP